MIKDVACISSQSIVSHFMLQVVVSSKSSHGILNRECPPERSRDATIFLCARRYAIIVFHKKVFPVPP
jgi:hypothetical protein